MFERGAWLAICDRCGFRFKSTQIKTEWTGKKVCCGPDTNGCFEERSSQEYVKPRVDRDKPAWTRPEKPGVFIVPGPIDTTGY